MLASLSDGFTRSRPLPATLPLHDFEFFSPSPSGGALPVRRICTEGCPHDRFWLGLGFGLGLALPLALSLALALALTWPGKVFECPQEKILPCETEDGPSAFNTPSWLAAGGSVIAAPGVLIAGATPGAATKDAASKCLLDA